MKKLRLTLFSALLLGGIGSASAVPLSDLLAGDDLLVDDKLFGDWTFEVLLDSGPTAPDAALIDVNGISSAGDPDPYDPGPGLDFQFNGQLSAVDDNILNVLIGFSVEALDPDHPIKDNLLELTGWTFDPLNIGGIVDVVETVYDAAGNVIGSKQVFADNLLGIELLQDSADFDPTSKIFVEKSILVAGDVIGDVVSLDSVEQRFSQVPLPGTLLLLGLGLAGFGFARRRAQAA
jgi:hypothetical protein